MDQVHSLLSSLPLLGGSDCSSQAVNLMVDLTLLWSVGNLSLSFGSSDGDVAILGPSALNPQLHGWV